MRALDLSHYIFRCCCGRKKKQSICLCKKIPKLKKKDTILSGQRRYDSSGRNKGREYI